MFSRYEIYTITASLYCYKDTNVLINKLGIKDENKLKEAEKKITTIKQFSMLENPIKGHFTKSHYFKIHKFMFEDIYPFAGRLRRESIAKGTTTFYPPQSLGKELNRVFNFIKEKNNLKGLSKDATIDALAYIWGELNIIHPFREGNGRATREFIRLLALNNKLEINWGNIEYTKILDASIDSVDDYKVFIPILKKVTLYI